MDFQKEQSIKIKLESIKTEVDETTEIRIRKVKSLINQMNLHLLQNPTDTNKILALQKLAYEAILYILDSDKQNDAVEMQRENIVTLIAIVESEIKTLS